MSFVSATFPSQRYSKKWRPEGKGGLFKGVCNAARFLRDFRTQLRFGELSRAPLELLRMQLFSNTIECDWLARSPDPWDMDLARRIQQRHASLQTLHDAIDVRALVFEALPQVQTAYFRVYRETSNDEPEMILTGSTQRNDDTSPDVHSLVMRAKVLGFNFDLEEDILCKISIREPAPVSS
jgi:hypothetical protein